MPHIPRVRGDRTLGLGLDPYHFIRKHADRLHSEVFITRLMLRKTICLTGPDAAQLFNDNSRMMRKGAAPLRVQQTLLGRGGMQTLDDAAHRNRKEMLLSLMSPERIAELVSLVRAGFEQFGRKWMMLERVKLYPEMQELLTRAVCTWAGVPLPEHDVEKRTRQLSALFDYAGRVGPKYWRARQARIAAEQWIASFVEDVRAGRHKPAEFTAAYRIAFHRDEKGELLQPRLAAVELLNVLRPTVAVSVYIVFVAHALHSYPQYRKTLARGDKEFARAFVQEVRRFYPFFPATPAKTRTSFEWHGYQFPANTRVMLDLHGTNHDPHVWESPEEFRPERFGAWDGSAFNFIPQGSGDHHVNHRCPGEWITIELMLAALQFFVHRIDYSVPEQDLTIDERRLPAMPRSKFLMERVHVV